MNGGGNNLRPRLPGVTLICVDTTDRVALAERAIEKSMEQCEFGAVKLLTHEAGRKHAVVIPRIQGVEAYSNFCIQEMHRYVETPHALVVQWDGYVLNGGAWMNHFLDFDYIGAPWEQWRMVGNGGFSLRSRRLLKILAEHPFGDQPHPEDNYICFRHRQQLEAMGIRFATLPIGRAFAFEGRSYDGKEWQGLPIPWSGQFGFHSWDTPLPTKMDRPMVFHHSGDMGDVIYALAAVKSLGGGVLFLSPDCRHPFPHPPRACSGNMEAWVQSVASLAGAQPYVWWVKGTAITPPSTDVDFNEFRIAYQRKTAENWASLLDLHLRPWDLEYDPEEPWLTVKEPRAIEGKPIVVNRTGRFRNDAFPWWKLVQRYGEQMVFVGSREEYENFAGFAVPNITLAYQPTANLLELAQVIAGGKVFIGNQSCPMAIALGLGKPVVQEVWRGNPNCRLKRSNAIYHETAAEIEIPPAWLK